MKVLFYIFSFLVYIDISAQCTNSITNLGSPVCSDRWTVNYSSGIVKIIFDNVGIGNTVTFTTVGETLGDTYLSYYNSSGVLLATNDDASDCGSCKQSTLSYVNTSSSPYLTNSYLIVSKPNCEPLNFNVKIKYNVRGPYDPAPVITFPTSNTISLCNGNTVDFDATGASSDPWESLDQSVVVINKTTGFAEFKSSGIAKILVKGSTNNCNVVNNYVVCRTSSLRRLQS